MLNGPVDPHVSDLSEPMPASDTDDSQTDPSDGLRSIHIQFAPSQGSRLRRSASMTVRKGKPLWAERPMLLERVDGTYELVGTSTNLDGLTRWILSHGADAEVKGPERLRWRVAAEARRIVQRYDSEAERPR